MNIPSVVQAPINPPALELELELEAELEPELDEPVAAAVAVVFVKRAEETDATLVTLVTNPEVAEVLMLIATAELVAPKPDTLKIETDVAALDAAGEAAAAVHRPELNPAAELEPAWLLAGAAGPALPLTADEADWSEEEPLEPPAEPPLQLFSGQQFVPTTS